MNYEKTRRLYQEIDQINKFEETADFYRYNKELKWAIIIIVKARPGHESKKELRHSEPCSLLNEQ